VPGKFFPEASTALRDLLFDGMAIAAGGFGLCGIPETLIPGKMVKGPGGAMDLVAGARRIIVLMEHVSKEGTPKFRRHYSVPLTGRNVVDILITNLAMFARPDRASPFALLQVAPGVSADEIRNGTEADYVGPGAPG
jgi:3-oxoacid CoA-transferase B subunit